MNLECLEITQDEKDALYRFQGTGHKELNALMTSGSNSELSYTTSKLSSMNEFNYFESDEQLIEIINRSKLMYSAMIKNMYKAPINNKVFYRGTNKTNLTDKNQSFLSTTADASIAKNVFAVNFENEKAFAKLYIRGNIPYYSFKNDSEYGDNQEQEILLGPFLNLEVSQNDDIYMVNVSKNNFEKSDTSIDDILSFRQDYTNTIKKIVNNTKKLKENSIKYNNLNEGMRTGRFDRSEFKYVREDMEKLINEHASLKDENNILEEKFNNYKKDIQSYLKSSFLNIEKNIEAEIEKETIKQQELTKLRELQKLQDEKNLMLNNIKIRINDFINAYNKFIQKSNSLNKAITKYDLTPITYDSEKITNLLESFYNNLENLDNGTLKQISIKLRANNFEEFFKEVEYKDNYQVCSKIKEIICGYYRNEKLIENNARLEEIYNNKGLLNKLSGKQKKENIKASFILDQNNSLTENTTYDFEYIKNNLTNNEQFNQQLLENIDYFEKLYQFKNYSTKVEDILKIFDTQYYNKHNLYEVKEEENNVKTK